MCSYGLDKDEIADVMERLELESNCEGDFSEQVFLAGAKEYIKRLRKAGADIPKN